MLPGKIFTPEDILSILRRRIWLILVPVSLIAAGMSVYASRLPDIYQAQAVLLVVPPRVPESYVRSTITQSVGDRLGSIAQQILSRSRLERIIQDFNLYEQERKTGIMEDVVDGMRASIGVQPVRGDTFRITFISRDPRAAARVTERLASLFIEENLKDREQLAQGTSQFLEAQLEDAHRRLIDQEKKLEDYRRTHAGQLPSQAESNLQALSNIQTQRNALVESMNRDQERRLLLQRQIADLEEQIAIGIDEPLPVAAGGPPAAQQLADAKVQLAALALRLKEDHPEMKRAKRIVRDLEKKAELEAGDLPVSEGPRPPTGEALRKKRVADFRAEMALLDKQLGNKQVQEQSLSAVAATYQQRLEQIPTRESEMVELTRDYATIQGLYTTLLGKKEDSKIAENLERRQISEQFKLLDPARVPERPFSPDRKRMRLMGVVAGLAIGLVFIALFEYLDNTFKTDQELAAVMPLPVLAVVPFMQSDQEKRRAWRMHMLTQFVLGSTVASGVAVLIYTVVR